VIDPENKGKQEANIRRPLSCNNMHFGQGEKTRQCCVGDVSFLMESMELSLPFSLYIFVSEVRKQETTSTSIAPTIYGFFWCSPWSSMIIVGGQQQ
jgi:hypothetical protein